MIAIAAELSKLQAPRPVETLFLGGGTPSILPEALMDRMCDELARWLPLAKDGEWSIEANPLDVQDDYCRHLCRRGMNRISIGGQSFQSHKLRQLERDHSGADLLASIECAMRHFDSVSIDLIFASPGESRSDWCSDLEMAIASGVPHISTYGLTYEKGASFWSKEKKGVLVRLSEDEELALYEEAIDRLTTAGYEHYEVSNFAKPGHRCRHNETYWNGGSWWAFGPSAARYVAGVRSVNHRGTLEYLRRIRNGFSPVDEMEILNEEQSIRDRFVFGMRRLQGVNWATLRNEASAQVADSIEASLQKHIQAGWVTREGDIVRLTHQGLLISDGLWKEYL
jgi:oxygen-independent coproporphyrinogen-3 oxidase